MNNDADCLSVCLSVALAHNGDNDKGRNEEEQQEEEERDAQMEDKATVVCVWCVSCRQLYIEFR